MLARDLGMTVTRLRREMPPGELTQWQALYELEHADRAHAAQSAKQLAPIRRRGRR